MKEKSHFILIAKMKWLQETANYHSDERKLIGFPLLAVPNDSILKDLKENQTGFLSFKRILIISKY